MGDTVVKDTDDTQSIQDTMLLIAESLSTIQHDMKLNDKGFLVLLQYHTKLPMKVCKTVVNAVFELEQAYGRNMDE